MKYFLAKTDPDTYSIDQFEKDQETEWDGVHNNQAILVIQKMRPGDTVFIYHSLSERAVVGLAEVIGEPYENQADTRRSWAVRMRFIRRTQRITLADIKGYPELANFDLVRNSRLSTMTVPDHIAQWLLVRT